MSTRTLPAEQPTSQATGPVRVWHDRDGAALRLRLDRPKANVLDAAMVAALTEELAGVGGQKHLRAVLLDAEGAHFSFGASVEEHLPGAVAGMLTGFHELIRQLLTCPVPVLVAVRGSCLGGGLEVAAAGSLLFVAPDARLGQPEVRLGVFAPAASCLLPQRIGQQATEDLLLSGRVMDAAEAERRGLAVQVADDPAAAALAWFDEHLAGLSAVAIRHALTAARGPFIESVSTRLAQLEHDYLTDLMATHDAVEGLSAFIEKRQAHWKDA